MRKSVGKIQAFKRKVNQSGYISDMKYENFDPYFPDQPVVDLYLPIWANLPSFHSKPAFIWSENGCPKSDSFLLTYSQLHNSVHLISQQLLTRLHKRDTVVILCDPGLDLVKLIFSCQRANLVSVPIYPQHHNYHHLSLALSQTNPTAIIAHQSYITSVFRSLSSTDIDKKLSSMLKGVTWISVDDIIMENNQSCSEFSYVSYSGCKPEETYLVQYTSGSTGIPRPVIVSAGSAAHNVRMARKSYDINPNSVIVSWLPQYHDCGLMFLLLTVVSGATCVLTSPGCFVNRPMIWLDLISEFKATCTPVPSFALPLVIKHWRMKKQEAKELRLCSLKNLIVINEPIYRSSVEEFVDVFKEFGLNSNCISPSYGLAENCTFVSTSWRPWNMGLELGNNNFQDMMSYKKLLPSARLDGGEMDEMEIVVVDEETTELLDDGFEGEIWVSSPSNASGYLGDPLLTREIFHNKLRNKKKTSHSFIRTGDRGIIKGKHRYLFVTGRSSDVIKLQNNQQIITHHHPHYIETAAYNSCPHFLRGGCLAAVKISETVAVIAEMQKTGEEEEDGLRKICEGIKRGVLMEEGVEIDMVVLVGKGSVPKTSSGKVKRWSAKEKLVGGGMRILMGVKFGTKGGVLKPLKMRNYGDQRKEEEFKTRPLLLSLL